MNFQRFSTYYCWSVNMSGIFCCFLCLPLLTSSFKHNYYDDGSLEDNQKRGFWDGVRGAEHITILDSESIEDFTRDNSESFVMFYANWCGASKRAKGEFAIAAQELAYTEGFSHLAFGAFDCATKSNQHVCQKIFDITKYPRFVYFKNGKRDRLYTVKCPRVADFFYNWVVNKGSEKYCAGSRESAKLFAFESSSASSLKQSGILPCLIISFMIFKIALFFSRSVLL